MADNPINMDKYEGYIIGLKKAHQLILNRVTAHPNHTTAQIESMDCASAIHHEINTAEKKYLKFSTE